MREGHDYIKYYFDKLIGRYKCDLHSPHGGGRHNVWHFEIFKSWKGIH